MGEKAIVTCAVVGAEVTREQSPAVPYTPAEIAAAAVDAWREGAAVVHLHARHPDGRPSQEPSTSARSSTASARPAATSSSSAPPAARWGWASRSGSARWSPAPRWRTLNMGTLNFGDDVFVNARPDIVRIAGAASASAGSCPECEVYDAGMLETLRWLLDKGHLARPYHVQFVLGVPGGMSGTERNLRFLVEGMPEPAHWTVAGIGRFEMPMAELALRLGGHVRVGLEDNLYLSKGVLAKGNQELVAAAVRLVAASGRGLGLAL